MVTKIVNADLRPVRSWLQAPFLACSFGIRCSHPCVDRAYLNGAAVFEMWTITCSLYRGVVVRSVDEIVAAEPLLGFAVGAVRYQNLTARAPQDLTGFILQLVTAQIDSLISELLAPGLI